jgi:hypothetical protein
MGNGDKDNDFADGGPTLIKLDTSLTIDLDTAYLLCSLQANSIEPNVIQAMILLFLYDFICLFSRLSFVHTLTIYYKQC